MNHDHTKRKSLSIHNHAKNQNFKTNIMKHGENDGCSVYLNLDSGMSERRARSTVK